MGTWSRRTQALLFVAAILILATPSHAFAWAVYKNTWPTLDEFRTSPAYGTKLTAIPGGALVWSDNETQYIWGGYSNNEKWLHVYYSGAWGWILDEYTSAGPVYNDIFQFQGYTNSVVTTLRGTETKAAYTNNGATVSNRAPLLGWDYWDYDAPDQNHVLGADVQLTTDPNFSGSFLINGGIGNCREWTPGTLTPGTYHWRIRTNSSVNGWGPWSSAWSFQIPKYATSLSTSSSASTVPLGGRLTLNGTLSRAESGTFGLGGRSIAVERSYDGAIWESVGSTPTLASGAIVFDAGMPTRTAWFRLRMNETSDYLGCSGALSRVRVQYPASLSWNLSRSSLRQGESLGVTGKLTSAVSDAPLAGGEVILERSTNNTSWSRVSTLTTNASGEVSSTQRPTRTYYWRLRFAGSDESSCSWSPKTTPSIRATVAAYLSRASVRTAASRYGFPAIAHGRSYAVSAYLKPQHSEGTYPAKMKIYYAKSGRWVYYKTVSAKAVNQSGYSKVTATLNVPTGGRYWYVRFVHLTDSANTYHEGAGQTLWAY